MKQYNIARGCAIDYDRLFEIIGDYISMEEEEKIRTYFCYNCHLDSNEKQALANLYLDVAKSKATIVVVDYNGDKCVYEVDLNMGDEAL